MWNHPEVVDCTNFLMDRKKMKFIIEDNCHRENKCNFQLDFIKFHPAMKFAKEQCNQDAYYFF